MIQALGRLAALMLLAAPAGAVDAPRLVLDAEIVWSDPSPRHGGVSAIEVGRGGSVALTVSDRGSFATVVLEREGGRLVGARTAERRPLRDTEGRAARGRIADAEGLALREDGRIYVSLKGPGRVWTWRDTGSEAAWMPRAPGFRELGANKALEALAIDGAGRLWTAPETPGGPLWVYEGGAWRVAAIREGAGGFKTVGADFGPDGALWLLERRVVGILFRSRIRRLEIEGTRVLSDEVVLTTAPGAHGNLEGLSVWRDGSGTLRLTAVEDDNFLPVARTHIVEWRAAP